MLSLSEFFCFFLRVHAVAIPVPGCAPIPDLQNDMEMLGLEGVAATDILDVIEGYIGEGYGIDDRELKGLRCFFLALCIHCT